VVVLGVKAAGTAGKSRFHGATPPHGPASTLVDALTFDSVDGKKVSVKYSDVAEVRLLQV
jgi:hypothetical protein